VSENNLAGTGIALGGAFAIADDQLALRARVADPQFLRTNWVAEMELLYSSARDFFGHGDVLVDACSTDPGTACDPTATHQDYAVATYKRFGGRLAFGHDLGISSQIFFEYRLEKIDATLPLAASDHRGLDVEPIDFMLLPGSSILSTLRATVTNDTRNDPFLTTSGHYLLAGIDASLTPFGSDYPYAKLVLRASQWLPLPWGGHVLQLQLFERFYVGDLSDLLPDRVLDLNFDRRPAQNFLGTDIVEIRYGNYAAKLDAEYRIPLYRGNRSIYGVDLFASVGIYGLANEADLLGPPRGYQGFGTVPIDLTFNAGLRIDTQAGGFVLGLANVLGLLPEVHGPSAARP
jgi:outer membrane protein assembly factor BamA